MILKYKLGAEDFKATQELIMKQVMNTSNAQFKVFLFNVVAWIPFGAASVLYYMYFERNLDDYLPLSIIAVLFFLWFTLFMLWNVYRRSVYTKSITSKSALYRQPHTLETNRHGFKLTDSLFTTEVEFSSIRNVTSDDLRLFLIIEPALVFTIPKSAFSHPGMQQEFIDTMTDAIKY